MDDTPEPSYADAHNERNDAYRAEYRAWIMNLTDDEKEDMRSRDPRLLHPSVDSMGTGGPELDEARLADEHTYNPFEDHELAQEAAACFSGREDLLDSLRAMTGMMAGATDQVYTAKLIMLALDVRRPRRKWAEWCAREHMVSTDQVLRQAEVVRKGMDVDGREDRVALARVAGEVLASSNIPLAIDVLLLISGLCYEGESQTSIARRHDVTRAAVSKRCVEFVERLGLPPARAMKSEDARVAYREAQLKRGWEE